MSEILSDEQWEERLWDLMDAAILSRESAYESDRKEARKDRDVVMGNLRTDRAAMRALVGQLREALDAVDTLLGPESPYAIGRVDRAPLTNADQAEIDRPFHKLDAAPAAARAMEKK